MFVFKLKQRVYKTHTTMKNILNFFKIFIILFSFNSVNAQVLEKIIIDGNNRISDEL